MEKLNAINQLLNEIHTISEAQDTSLFDALRKLRKQIATQLGMPPYIIFNDSTLLQMVDLLPANRIEMMLISGMSYTKYEKYGYLFEQRIAELSVGMSRKSNSIIEQNLSDEKIKNYIAELKNYN